MTEPFYLAPDGTQRKYHYGPPGSRQPWDDIVDEGWGPQTAAAMILKYLRRTKQVKDSREKARWYWKALIDLMGPKFSYNDREIAGVCMHRLLKLLTEEEKLLLD